MNVTNFDEVVIKKFWEGSVGVDFDVKLKAFHQGQPINSSLVKNELSDVKTQLLKLDKVDQTYVNVTFDDKLSEALHVLEEFSRDVCKSEHICNDTHVCNSTSQVCDNKCFNFRCPVNAQCYVTDQHTAQCRCKTDDKFVYGGADCSEVAEKMALTSTQIIAIGTGVGGAVVVMAVIIIAVVILRTRRRRVPDEQTTDADSLTDDASIEEQRQQKSVAASSHDVMKPDFHRFRLEIPRPRVDRLHHDAILEIQNRNSTLVFDSVSRRYTTSVH
ncbi:uncharacterized protein LOC131947001 [Physella acuta]|uniref:uncharacterized protein LOC131947001 n=1 Tax=Physella acuta TaxID=109671 RepID=UPI0027DC512E|nr:uncharacterized protein LOC131947001 [Physella acuta]